MHIHHGTRGEGDNEHEKPVGKDVEEPQDVGKRHAETELGNLALEGVEVGVDLGPALISSLVGDAEGDHVVRGDQGDVEAVLVDVDLLGVGENVDGPDVASTDHPAAAQEGLVIAVEVTHLGAARRKGELGGSLVEGLVELTAAACPPIIC